MLSDNTYKKYMGHRNELEALYPKKTATPHWIVVEPTESNGQIIYTPHDCKFPNPWETPIGAIWECHEYEDGRRCYDQWIVVSKRGSRLWELFKRNF